MWQFIYFFNGFFFGVFALLVVQGLVVYRFVNGGFKKQRSQSPIEADTDADDNEQPDMVNEDFVRRYANWPPSIVDFLKSELSSESAQPATLEQSLNVLVHRFFIEAQKSPILSAKIKAKLVEKIGGSGSILQSAQVDQITFGQKPPTLHDIKVMRSENLDVVFACKVEYEGGFNIKITTLLSMGIKIPVSVRLGRLKGLLQMRFPSPIDPTSYAMAFTREPELELIVESSLWRRENEMFRDVLNGLISKRLRNAFINAWTLPNWRSFSMPMITIRPPDVEMLRLLHPEEVLLAGNSVKPRISASPRLNSSGSAASLLTEPQNDDGADAGAKIVPSSVTLAGDTITEDIPSSNNLGYFMKRRFSHPSASSPTIDILESKCFPVTSFVNSVNISNYSDALVNQFVKLANEVDDDSSFADAWTSTRWEKIRSKRTVEIFRKFVVLGKDRSEAYKAIFTVECNAEKAFQIIGNPEYLRHTEDSFVDSGVVGKDVELRKFVYKIGRSDFSVNTLEVKKKLEGDGDLGERYVVVYRSACTDNYDSNPSQAKVYVHGYLISQMKPEAETTITIVSQYDPSLSKLNPSITRCQRIKSFVEELAEWSKHLENQNDATLKQMTSFTSPTDRDKKMKEKLKNFSSMASNVLKAGKALAATTSVSIVSATSDAISAASKRALKKQSPIIEAQNISVLQEETHETEEHDYESIASLDMSSEGVQPLRSRSIRSRSSSQPSPPVSDMTFYHFSQQ